MDLLYLMKRELLRRKYSHRTIVTYSHCLRHFLNWCEKEPRRITKYDVSRYLYRLCDHKKSASTLNVNLQAIKFALEEILNKRFFVKMPYSKVPERIPRVLSKEEVQRIFDAIKNPTHLLIVKLLYSAGLRLSETVGLRVEDLEMDKGFGWVRQGKGNKDRVFVVAEALKNDLARHISTKAVGSFIFSGFRGHLSPRTVQEIVRQASKKAGLKGVHPHTLRHSFTTHLIEAQYPLTTVQALLGHNSPDTTMVYVHAANVKMLNVQSPLDSFQQPL
ncbi:MAG: tyrosine-type recombinase/integrase [Candidatus Woesearchaeota archaeon]